MAEDHEARLRLLQHALEPLQTFGARLPGNARVHDLASDRALEHRGIGLVAPGAGPEREAVAEGEHDRRGLELVELAFPAACGGEENEKKRDEFPHRADSATLSPSPKGRERFLSNG